MTATFDFDLHPVIADQTLDIDSGERLVVRRMKVDEYLNVRELLPREQQQQQVVSKSKSEVSRCRDVYDAEVVRKMMATATFFPFVVVQDGGAIVGYAELHRMPHFGRGFDGRLEKVLVVEKFRGKKIAQKMCGVLLVVARDILKCGRLDLTVEKPDARKVYSNLGFSKLEGTEVMRLMF